MSSKRRMCFYFIYILPGFFAFSHQAGVYGSSRGDGTTGKTCFFFQLPTYPRDCREVLDQSPDENSSGVFLIKPDGYHYPFEVYCNNSFESGGWTVLMRRFDGSLVFSRNWNEYKKGFGFLSREFWLGNEKLAILTNQKTYELRLDITTSNGSQVFVTYSIFRVSDEWSNYALASLCNAVENNRFLISRPTCPNNMIYKKCICERTCEAPTICQNNCQEASRCVCPGGFFLRGRGSDCVSPEECPCYSSTANKVIPVGESYMNNQCSELCSCSGSGLSCSNYGCDPHARCTSRPTNEGGQCTCTSGFTGDGVDCGCRLAGYLVDGLVCRLPRDCAEVPLVNGYSGSGLYYILPSNWQEFQVYCNMSGGLWTVFQRRIRGSGREFTLSWNSYKRGFGEPHEDFWLGNDRIHYLTKQRNYQLRIELIDSEDRHYRAQYNGFRIGIEESNYQMTVLGSYLGNAGNDAMRHHLNQPFSTHDRDNDDSDTSHYCNCYGHCARLHEGGWWYRYRPSTTLYACDRYHNSDCDRYYSCAYSNLNGEEVGNPGKTIFWHGLPGNDCGIKYTEMKIRPL